MKGLSTALLVLITLASIVAIFLVWFFGTYNLLIGKQIAVKTQWAQVESQYQRRYDLIPNLVESVKGYLIYEKSVLEDVTRLRSQWMTQTNPDDKIRTTTELEATLSKLLVIIENYPELKASENVRALMDELAGTENRIAVERMRYNERVQDYNTAIRVFPNSFVARQYGFEEMEMFKAETGAEKGVKVNITIE